MLRSVALLSVILVAACDQQGENPADVAVETAQPATIYSGPGRNQLCLKGRRAGFVVYASGDDTNCSVRGTFKRGDSQLVIAPDGDSECRIQAGEQDSSLALGPVPPACAYYCGPGASFAGATFDMIPASRPVTDFAGDPLC